MEYISVSSLVSDFWGLLFFPFIRISLTILLLRFVFGKDRFNSLKSELFNKILQYSKKIKYRERLDKAVPIVNIFLIFSFLYLSSILYSTIETFVPISVSFGNNHLSSEMVLNVWSYHPYIKDFSTLQRVVYYKAQENKLGTFELLSEEGLRNLPEILLRSLIVFTLILLISLFLFSLTKIIKRGFFERVSMIFRAVLALFILTSLLIGICFLNKNYIYDYSIQAWSQYESQLLSSGAPPELDIDIKKEKLDEVNEYIDEYSHDFYASLGLGPTGVLIRYANCHLEFNVIHYHY